MTRIITGVILQNNITNKVTKTFIVLSVWFSEYTDIMNFIFELIVNYSILDLFYAQIKHNSYL